MKAQRKNICGENGDQQEGNKWDRVEQREKGRGIITRYNATCDSECMKKMAK